jgi:DNA mismatch endonuclease (patch repair protein)
MTDRLTPAQRHKVMSHIRSRNTKPEKLVRQWLWRHGYRYRLNVKSVPGKPDIVMRKYRTAIFVNGCFWHGHFVELGVRSAELGVRSVELGVESRQRIVDSSCCKIPQTNREFWVNKIKRNQERDRRNYQVLHDNGWQVIVVWECQLAPKCIEETMLRVELLLNENFLALHQSKVVPYPILEDDEVPMAAEGASYYGL